MKTIIIYSSTYGYAKDCASELSKQLKGEVLLVNVSTDKIPSLNEFDNVVIGGSIYMGQISKKIKAYCTSNVDLLKNKRVGLFLCCGLPKNFEKNIKNSFPEELLEKAISLDPTVPDKMVMVIYEIVFSLILEMEVEKMARIEV